MSGSNHAMQPQVSEVTRILSAIQEGNPRAAEQLLPLVYEELRRLAARKVAQEKPGQTLQPTALVHEAYLRLVGAESQPRWDSRGHFFAAAAEAMRRILIDQARRKKSAKAGGGLKRLDLDDGLRLAARSDAETDEQNADELLALDDALRQFEVEDPAKARLVKLRYFAGLTLSDAAAALGISEATAKRHWVYARSWLYGRVKAK
jgi:RNA polymerase sigma factor (TIGR02999 family)